MCHKQIEIDDSFRRTENILTCNTKQYLEAYKNANKSKGVPIQIISQPSIQKYGMNTAGIWHLVTTSLVSHVLSTLQLDGEDIDIAERRNNWWKKQHAIIFATRKEKLPLTSTALK